MWVGGWEGEREGGREGWMGGGGGGGRRRGSEGEGEDLLSESVCMCMLVDKHRHQLLPIKMI